MAGAIWLGVVVDCVKRYSTHTRREPATAPAAWALSRGIEMAKTDMKTENQKPKVPGLAVVGGRWALCRRSGDTMSLPVARRGLRSLVWLFFFTFFCVCHV